MSSSAMLRTQALVICAISLLLAQRCQSGDPHRPQVVAHRGLQRHAPENTLAAFRACLELRIGFEFDVRQTRDGALVCIHDRTVDRTTNGTGQVSTLTLREIRELDAGSWFDPKFVGEHVPTVEEVLELAAAYRQHQFLIRADIKTAGVEDEVISLANKHQLLDKVLFIEPGIKNPGVRSNVRRASKRAHVGSVANDQQELVAAISAEEADWVKLRFLPTPEQVEALHRAGKKAFIAGPTVSGRLTESWRTAVGAGVDAILTDFPLELSLQLRQTTPR